jgi:hypothetical protein
MTPPPSFDKIGEEHVRQIVDLSPGQRKRYLGQLDRARSRTSSESRARARARASAPTCVLGVWQRRFRKNLWAPGALVHTSTGEVWTREGSSSLVTAPPKQHKRTNRQSSQRDDGNDETSLAHSAPSLSERWKSTAAGNLNHLSRPDGSCLAGWRAARNSRWESSSRPQHLTIACVRAAECVRAGAEWPSDGRRSGPQTVRRAG